MNDQSAMPDWRSPARRRPWYWPMHAALADARDVLLAEREATKPICAMRQPIGVIAHADARAEAADERDRVGDTSSPRGGEAGQPTRSCAPSLRGEPSGCAS